MIDLMTGATRCRRRPMSPVITRAADTFLAVTFPFGGVDA
jgi:hypothetical protein